MIDDKRIADLLREMRGRYAIPRNNAAETLVKIGAPAVPGVIQILDNKNPEVQELAADVLTRIGTPEALTAVAEWRQAKISS